MLEDDLSLPDLNPVSSISTGVLGQTGIETSEYIKGVVDIVKPDLAIIIDAIATLKSSNLGKTIQITNTGITPGSGVGNYRKTIDESTLNIPVISIGVPTVIRYEEDDDLCRSNRGSVRSECMRTAGITSGGRIQDWFCPFFLQGGQSECRSR
jgi:hypothetical protein